MKEAVVGCATTTTTTTATPTTPTTKTGTNTKTANEGRDAVIAHVAFEGRRHTHTHRCCSSEVAHVLLARTSYAHTETPHRQTHTDIHTHTHSYAPARSTCWGSSATARRPTPRCGGCCCWTDASLPSTPTNPLLQQRAAAAAAAEAAAARDTSGNSSSSHGSIISSHSATANRGATTFAPAPSVPLVPTSQSLAGSLAH
jgi:hypothetical protein